MVYSKVEPSRADQVLHYKKFSIWYDLGLLYTKMTHLLHTPSDPGGPCPCPTNGA